MAVYFFTSGSVATSQLKIKIGYTDGNTYLDVKKRRSRLQTGNPEGLRILRIIKGTRWTERHLKQRYKKQRYSEGGREWFHFHPEMLEIHKDDEIYSDNRSLLFIAWKWRTAIRDGGFLDPSVTDEPLPGQD